MKYCSQCGSTLSFKKVKTEEMKRYICDGCQKIHYQNPINVSGCLLFEGSKILLCKRAIEPRYGKWTLPAGFVENYESTAQGAKRETKEEAGVIIEIKRLYAHINVVHLCQVHCFYLGKIVRKGISFGHESLEVRFFESKDIPWSELSFPTVEKTLGYYFEKGENAPVFELEIDKDLKR